MSEDGRSIPPSEGRIAAASREGLFRGSPLVTTGLVAIAVAAVLAALWDALADRLEALVVAGLFGALRERTEPGEAMAKTALDGLAILAPILGAVVGAAAIVWAVRTASPGKGRGQTSVPLRRPRDAGVSGAVITLVGALLVVLFAARVFVHHLGDLANVDPLRAEGSFAPRMLLGLLAGAGALTALTGLALDALGRARVMADLRLSRTEAAREERAQRGDRRVRATQRSAAREEGGDAR